MTSALFGLAGVVIGVVLTASLNLLLERRRERRRIRAASRLVQEEFVDGLISLTQVHLFDRNAVVTRPFVVEERAWLEHRGALAEALDGAAWTELTWAAKHRREMIDWIAQKNDAAEPFYADDYTLTKISNCNYWFNRGWDALAAAAGVPRRKRRALRREREKAAESAHEPVS